MSAYIVELKKHLEKRNVKRVVQTAKKAFKDPKADEETLAWVAGLIYESNTVDAFDLIPHFVERFPDSLHMVRVYNADLCARQGNFDSATNESRIYLRQVKEAGVVENFETLPVVIREGIPMAYLLLTAAYTEMGARSYSKRVLRHALSLPLSEAWRERLQEEMDACEQDLMDRSNRERDDLWENFFREGNNAEELYDLASKNNFPVLATRTDVLASQFQYNQSFQVDDSEIYLVLIGSDEGAFSLV